MVLHVVTNSFVPVVSSALNGKERMNSLLRGKVVVPKPVVAGAKSNTIEPETQKIIVWPNLTVCLYFFRCECTAITSFPANCSSSRASTDRESQHSSVYSNSGCDAKVTWSSLASGILHRWSKR